MKISSSLESNPATGSVPGSSVLATAFPISSQEPPGPCQGAGAPQKTALNPALPFHFKCPRVTAPVPASCPRDWGTEPGGPAAAAATARGEFFTEDQGLRAAELKKKERRRRRRKEEEEAAQRECVGWVVSRTFLPVPPPRAEPGTNTGTGARPCLSPAPSKQGMSPGAHKERASGSAGAAPEAGTAQRGPCTPLGSEATLVPPGCQPRLMGALHGSLCWGKSKDQANPEARVTRGLPESQAAVATAQNNAAKQARGSSRCLSREGSTG